MSIFRFGLQVVGPLDVLEGLEPQLDGLVYDLRRQGERSFGGIQPVKGLFVHLARWERGGIYTGDDREAILAEEHEKIAATTAALQRLAPALANLDRSKTRVSFWISTIREEEEGGFELPADLVAAAAAAGLRIAVSIMVAFDDDDQAE
jgi:hypothetical protein